MRYAIAASVVALLGLGFVLHERKSVLEHHLGQVATQLAGRSVGVHCQGVTGELLDVGAESGTVQYDADGHPADKTDLKRPVCNALKRFAGEAGHLGCVVANTDCDRRAFEDVIAVHTLAHESWHLRGVANEGEAECYSLQTTAQAAELLGLDVQHADAIAHYYVEKLLPRMPSEYRAASCGNGGPLDLRPADPVWP